MNVLVDTPVWSLSLRRKPEDLSSGEKKIVAELTELVQEGRGRIIGPVRQELLSGIRTTRQYEELRAALRAFPDETIGAGDYETAAKASNDCRAKGIVVSPVDVLICAVALRVNFPMFATADRYGNSACVLTSTPHARRR